MSNTNRFLYSLLISLFIIGAIFTIAKPYIAEITKTKTIVYSDYGDFYQSLHSAQQGKSLYNTVYYKKIGDQSNPTKITALAPNLNPPLFSLLIYPLGYLSYANSFVIWVIFSALCGLCSILLLQKMFAISYKLSITFGLLLAFFIYIPTFSSLQFGQVSLFLLLLLIVGWHYLRTNRSNKAAIILAFTATIKPFLGLFLLYFLLKKQWRALVYFCLTGIVLSLIALLFFSKQSYIDYLATLQHVNWYSSTWNASLLGTSMRIFGSNREPIYSLFTLPYLTTKIYWLCSGLLIALLIHYIHKNDFIESQKKLDLDFSLIIVIGLLVSPFGWVYYFPWLIIPVIVLQKTALQNSQAILLSLIICSAVLLSSLPSTNLPPHAITYFSRHFIISFLYPTGLLVLIGLICYVRPHLSNKYPNHTPFNYLIVTLYITVLLPSLLGILVSENVHLPTAVITNKLL